MKKIVYLMILLFPLLVFASNDYDIENFEINIETNKDHSYNYTEEVGVVFYGNERYIIRNLDENERDFKANKNYAIETNETSILKIYSKNASDTYEIKYSIKEEKPKNNYYEFYLKNNYDSEVKGTKFTIKLPDSVNKNNVTFMNGKYDITDLVDYSVKGNTITGTYNKTINSEKEIKVIIDYGRFYINSSTLVCIIVPIILTLFSGLLWLMFGKDLPKRIEKTAKFARNITPLHIALANHGEIRDEDNFYLLLHLASKGYLTITEEKNEYYIKKNKDYKESNYVEALFFKTIFRAGESISLSEYLNIISEKRDNKKKIYQTDRIEPKYLKRKFKNASRAIKRYLEEQNEKDKYFEDKPEKIKSNLILMIALILILITSLPFVEINVLELLPLSVILSIAIFYILIKFVKNTIVKTKENKTVLAVTIGVMFTVLLLVPSFQRNLGFIIAFIVSLVCSIIILFIYKYMPKRTIYGQNIYNKTEGFKELINNITDEELDRLLELNENYLLDILPISYELGVSNKVIELLKKTKTKEPEWFKVPNKFNYSRLNTSILNLREILTEEEQ